jgi:hypothetical protein
MSEPQEEQSVFETETMAELCARQGRLGEAITIYRRLMELPADAPARARWAGRLEALERTWGRAGGQEIAALEIPLPAAPGVAVAANDDGVTVAWSLAPETPEPMLEVLLIQRTPSGVETTKRAVPLAAHAGRIAFAAPGLHSALAAVGRREADQFVPLARSTRR